MLDIQLFAGFVALAPDLRVCKELAAKFGTSGEGVNRRWRNSLARLLSAEQIEKRCALRQLGIDVLFLHKSNNEHAVCRVDKEQALWLAG